jgi:hypothetical protein
MRVKKPADASRDLKRWRRATGSERSTLERVISDLQRSGAAALTPRLQAARGGWLVECQALCS